MRFYFQTGGGKAPLMDLPLNLCLNFPVDTMGVIITTLFVDTLQEGKHFECCGTLGFHGNYTGGIKRLINGS